MLVPDLYSFYLYYMQLFSVDAMVFSKKNKVFGLTSVVKNKDFNAQQFIYKSFLTFENVFLVNLMRGSQKYA